MMKHWRWLAIAALALGGCTDLCPGDRTTGTMFVEMATYGDEIAACIRGQDCARLCRDAFHADVEGVAIERCEVSSVSLQDGTVVFGPIAPSIDLASVHGVTLRASRVAQVSCDAGIDIAGGDDSTAGDSSDDGSCDSSCDDGSDDGSSDDGSGDDGSGDDGSGDDGGDDGGGDDGGGDDGGDLAPAPVPGAATSRAPAAIHRAHLAQHPAGRP